MQPPQLRWFFYIYMNEGKNKIYGIRTVIEAINAGSTLEKVFVQKGLRSSLYRELEGMLHTQKIPVSYVPVEKLNRLSKNGNHQGVVALISPITYVDIETLVERQHDEHPLFLLLDELSDVRNFGAIIRTAECTGVTGIIIPKKGAAPINADTVKTSAGAVFNVPICKVDHIKDAIYFLQGSGISVIAATEKADQLVYEANFNQACAVVMGSEGRGINPSVLKLSDQQVRLPMQGTIGSLNVSVACGAFLYEALRQRL